MSNVDGVLTVGIVPVSGQLNLKSLARAVGGSRAAMADLAAAERATGYVAGGISPIGQKRAHPTVLDKTARPSTPRSSSRPVAAASTSRSRRPTWWRSPGAIVAPIGR